LKISTAEQKLILGRQIRLSLLPPRQSPKQNSRLHVIDQFIAAKMERGEIAGGKKSAAVVR